MSKTFYFNPNSVESPLAQSLSLFPQPAQNQIFIKWSYEGIGQLKIYNALGQEMTQNTIFPQEQKVIPINDWQSGIYLLVMEVSGEIIREKVLIRQ